MEEYMIEDKLNSLFSEVRDLGNGEYRQINDFFDVQRIISEKISPDFANFIFKTLGILLDAAKDTELEERINADSDFSAIEGENEEWRNTVFDINELVGDYLEKLDAGEQKFSRQRVLPILQKIHKTCDSML